ncbi:arsenate reductase (glutaredoxin) [Orbus wheelerorum]|uniref:arsenate reductase (glutaredoxin) n=1 Tax=Orbus wheelerorum TaxID=3074111 RepID=UPI00370DE15A
MQPITIYHNPKCSKSRETLALLTEKGIEPQIILYLDAPPSINTLKTLLKQLGFESARQLMRTKDDLYKELELDNEKLNEEQLLTAMHQNPKLIERPIVVANGKAKIGRPPESVLLIL